MNYNKLQLFLMITLSVIAGCKNPSGNDLEDTEKPDTEKPSFTLSYNANGADSGSVPDSGSYIEGESITLAGNSGSLAKSGYPLFIGWNTADDGSGDFYRPGSRFEMPGSNQILYAWWVSPATLSPSNLYRFGNKIAIDGDYLVSVDEKNSVYVFHRTGLNSWDSGFKLTAPSNQRFGCSVAISGDSIIVGDEYFKSTETKEGAAYIFKRTSTNSWTLEKTLSNENPAADDNFGSSVDIDGDSAAVGMPGFSKNAVYIYHKSGGSWSKVATLNNSTASDKFGCNVDLDGDHLLVGAYTAKLSDGPINQGLAYIYKKGTGYTWTRTATLSSPNAEQGGYFGLNADLSGDYVLAGVPGEGSDGGNAYIFYRGSGESWDSSIKLTGNSGGYFGSSVSLVGDIALVGDETADGYKGAAFLYRRTGSNSWSSPEKISDPDGSADDYFNITGMGRDYLAVGSWGADSQKGRVLVLKY